MRASRHFRDLGGEFAPYWKRMRCIRRGTSLAYVPISLLSPAERRNSVKPPFREAYAWCEPRSIVDHFRNLADRFVRAKFGRIDDAETAVIAMGTDGLAVNIHCDSVIQAGDLWGLIHKLIAEREETVAGGMHFSTRRALVGEDHWGKLRFVFFSGKIFAVPAQVSIAASHLGEQIDRSKRLDKLWLDGRMAA